MSVHCILQPIRLALSLRKLPLCLLLDFLSLSLLEILLFHDFLLSIEFKPLLSLSLPSFLSHFCLLFLLQSGLKSQSDFLFTLFLTGLLFFLLGFLPILLGFLSLLFESFPFLFFHLKLFLGPFLLLDFLFDFSCRTVLTTIITWFRIIGTISLILFLRDYLDTGLGLINFDRFLDLALSIHDLSETAQQSLIIWRFFKEVLRVNLHFFFGLRAYSFCNIRIIGLSVGLMRLYEGIELVFIPVMESTLALCHLKFFI